MATKGKGVTERAVRDYWRLSRAFYNHTNGSNVTVQQALTILSAWLSTLEPQTLWGKSRNTFQSIEKLRNKIIVGKPEEVRREQYGS